MKPAVIAKMCGTKIKYSTAKDAAKAIEYHRGRGRCRCVRMSAPCVNGGIFQKKPRSDAEKWYNDGDNRKPGRCGNSPRYD